MRQRQRQRHIPLPQRRRHDACVLSLFRARPPLSPPLPPPPQALRFSVRHEALSAAPLLALPALRDLQLTFPDAAGAPHQSECQADLLSSLGALAGLQRLCLERVGARVRCLAFLSRLTRLTALELQWASAPVEVPAHEGYMCGSCACVHWYGRDNRRVYNADGTPCVYAVNVLRAAPWLLGLRVLKLSSAGLTNLQVRPPSEGALQAKHTVHIAACCAPTRHGRPVSNIWTGQRLA